MSISLTNRKLPAVHLSKKPPVVKPPRDDFGQPIWQPSPKPGPIKKPGPVRPD